ncbi:hypothetical protein [Streptomyces neyagawaensis]|uniref:LRV domain-containing protein n=1 Tax=Streptomyces neyagawaensis TaxID=42238 RepID=A0ABV3B8P2_9ACTN
MTYERSEVIQGLALNRAASAGVLLRLMRPEAKAAWFLLCRRTGLPAAVVDAFVTHPDWRMRASFAQSEGASAADRARLVDDTDRRVLLELAHGPTPYRAAAEPLPDAVYTRLLTAADPEVRGTAALSPSIPARVLAGHTGHDDPGVRTGVCRAWDALTPADREALLADPDAAVRAAAARRACRTDPAHTDGVLAAMTPVHRREILAGACLPRATAERLMDLDDPYDRQTLAGNPSLPPDLVARLAADPEHEVRRAVSARPELTEEQRAAVDHSVRRSDALRPLGWVLALDGDSDALRACAASAHRWLRRSAAVHPALPADLVERLAEDEDFVVRLMICEYQPDAPAGVLLRTVLEWDGRSVHDLVRLPQFPGKGLARYADHEEPRLRRLAVQDPDASPEVIERLTRDEAVWVRRAAASDPRLTRDRIEELLRDPDTAWPAASNPRLAEADMHRLLDAVGVSA